MNALALRRRAAGSCLAVLLAACALVLIPSGTAAAHPLGNFTVNRYDGLVVAPGELRIHHVEDLAEIPATQARPDIDRMGRAGWARERCATAAGKSRVTVGGETVAPTPGRSLARVRPGQAGLDTLRLECRWTVPLPDGSLSLRFRASVDDGPGWREVTARGDRTTLTASDVPEKSLSAELTKYPAELLSSPADTASASLRVRPGGPALVEEDAGAPASSVLPRGADRFTRALDDLVSRQDLTFGFALLALALAVLLGALHALAPGHGKTLMAATAAARGGRAGLRDVLPLAASVTITHTIGVAALGILVAAGSAAAPSVVTWLGVASGVLVTAAGITLARRAWRNRKPAHDHDHHHDHPHPHNGDGHDHSHPHDHHHAHEHDHPHVHTDAPERPLALAHASTGGAALLEAPAPAPSHSHPRVRTHTHTHGGSTHTHEIAPTVRGTILLGFAGGLVPSPSAVVVLVGAAALGKAWFGLLLVLAFGIGLALTLTAAGVAVVRLGGGVSHVLASRSRWAGSAPVALARRTVPLASALVVVALGLVLVFKGAATALG
ncbi:sulfite exporter TauE/SafE family protein [Streptomyces sp. MMBL 11-3]|uniref:urease accessory protein UreH domain-containing protein n=1 Tax=Streptomyces sp. MMBL 11-3 TaxID=3382639 RepID=UPI0039B6D80B